MEGKNVKEKQQRQLNVAPMPVQLTASGGPIVNGLHVPKLAEAVTSLVRDRKSNKQLMEGKSVKEK